VFLLSGRVYEARGDGTYGRVMLLVVVYTKYTRYLLVAQKCRTCDA
jgi:hypothetical protein